MSTIIFAKVHRKQLKTLTFKEKGHLMKLLEGRQEECMFHSLIWMPISPSVCHFPLPRMMTVAVLVATGVLVLSRAPMCRDTGTTEHRSAHLHGLTFSCVPPASPCTGRPASLVLSINLICFTQDIP